MELCDVVTKKGLEKLGRIDLWAIATHETPNVCRESSLLAAKVYAEKYVKGTDREKYYGKNLTETVINIVDDSGKLKTTDRTEVSKLIEFAGLLYME